MNTVPATNSHAITPLVSAGEVLFSTLTGKPLSDNAVKVSTGVSSLLDGLFPVLAERAPFDLDGVLTGSTEVLTGLNTAITAAKSKPVSVPTAAITGAA